MWNEYPYLGGWKDSALELSALVSSSKLGMVAGSTLRTHVLSLSQAVSGLKSWMLIRGRLPI